MNGASVLLIVGFLSLPQPIKTQTIQRAQVASTRFLGFVLIGTQRGIGCLRSTP